jgi:hypothetical protein
LTCIQPGAITPEELVACADGAAPEHVVDHVRRCRQCRAEVEQYASVSRRLRGALGHLRCPAPHRLGEMELGLLGPEETLQVARHVAECPSCVDELRTLRTFLAEEPVGRPGLVERLRRVVAALVEPASGLVQAYDSFRGPDDPTSRTYVAEDATITVSVEPGPEPGRALLLGLATREARPNSLAGLAVELVGDDGSIAEAETDAAGSFSFDDVAPGLYGLHLRLDDRVVVVEALSVDSPDED